MLRMQKSREYFRDKKREERRIEKELGVRYRGWEQIPGESFTEFKRRMTGKTVYDDNTKRYKAWEQMPNESQSDFKKRLTSKRQKLI